MFLRLMIVNFQCAKCLYVLDKFFKKILSFYQDWQNHDKQIYLSICYEWNAPYGCKLANRN